MKRQLNIGILVLLIVITGCKKNTTENNFVFTPLSYLPVYPCSFWKYRIGNDTIISRTSDTLTHFMGEYLSILDGEIIRHYDKWISYGIYNTGWVHILSEKVGDQFGEAYGDPRYYPSSIVFTVLQKTEDNNGDSIIIQKYVRYSAGPNHVPSQQWVYQIFKKEIGLFFECGIDSISKDTNYKKTLFNYFINRTWKP